MNNEDKMVIIGEASYDTGVTYKIEILKTNFRPGSGDYEDPPEIRNDEYGEFYKVIYTAPGESDVKAEGEFYASLDEAKKHVEANYKGVVWHDGA